jgi:hypothetical protein
MTIDGASKYPTRMGWVTSAEIVKRRINPKNRGVDYASSAENNLATAAANWSTFTQNKSAAENCAKKSPLHCKGL